MSEQINNSPDISIAEFFSGERIKKTGVVIVQAVKDFITDSGPQWAAAIAYYSLLSAFPLILAAASISSFFIEPQWAIDQVTNLLGDFLPQGEQAVEDIIQNAIEARGSVSILSIMALLWSGSRVFGVVTKALNIAYDVDESYSFMKRLGIELVMLLTIGLLFVAALASRYLLRLLSSQMISQQDGPGLLVSLLIQLVPVLLLFVSFFLIYLLVPRRRVDWKAAAVGAVLAVILFSIGRPIFFMYVNRFANFNLIYGAIAIVIILIIWAWIVASIMILGGEVVSHIQEIMIEQKNPQDVGRQHKLRNPLKKILDD